MSSRKWDEELHNYEYTETFVAKQSRTQSMPVRRSCPAPNLRTGILWVRDWSRRGLRRGRSVLYICRQKSQFADYRYKFSRNMCPRRPRESEISLDERCRKCPSDNVNNFVEIENFFIFGKNYHVRTKFSYFRKKL
jgi:hypothetical protein